MLPLELLQPRSMSSAQLKQLLALMALVRPALDFYLQHIVFPSVLKQRPHKLQANGVDLGGEMIFGQRFGFSGTPSDLLPPTLSPCCFEPGSEAKIIRNLCNPECMFIPQELVFDRNWNVHTLLQAVAHGNYSALIDTGALVTGLSNEEVRYSMWFFRGLCVFLVLRALFMFQQFSSSHLVAADCSPSLEVSATGKIG